MITSLEELRDIADRISTTAQRLGLVKRAHDRAAVEASARIERLKSDPSPSGEAYALLGAERHKADAEMMATNRRAQLRPLLEVGLFEATRLRGQLGDYLRAFMRDVQQAPDVESAFLKYTNQVGVSAEAMILLRVLEQTATANLRAELATAPPTRRAEMYRAASEAPHEPVNAVTIRLIESQPPYAENVSASDVERTAAASLGRLIREAREARVPAEVADVQAALDAATREIKSAESLGIIAVNPEHRSDVAQAAKQAEATVQMEVQA